MRSRSTGIATRTNVDVRLDLPLDREGSGLAADSVDDEEHRLSCPSRVDPDVPAAVVRRFVRAPHESDAGAVTGILTDGACYLDGVERVRGLPRPEHVPRWHSDVEDSLWRRIRVADAAVAESVRCVRVRLEGCARRERCGLGCEVRRVVTRRRKGAPWQHNGNREE